MLTLLNTGSRRDRRSRHLDETAGKSRETLQRITSEIVTESGATEPLLASPGAIGHTVRKRGRAAAAREVVNRATAARLAEQVAVIVVGALPLDEDALSRVSGAVRDNVEAFTEDLIAEGKIVSQKSFIENPSADVRDLAEEVLSDNEDSGKTSAVREKVSDVVRKKTEEVIKREVKGAKEREALRSELSEKRKAIAESGLGVFCRKSGRSTPGTFGAIVESTARAMHVPGEELSYESVIGEAAIRYAILETFNTMRLVDGVSALAERLDSWERTQR